MSVRPGPYPIIVTRKAKLGVLYVQFDVGPGVDAALIMSEGLARAANFDMLALHYATLLPCIAFVLT